jgi:lipopolysaccharide transport system permease protein/teichoic acid transport system permease protein
MEVNPIFYIVQGYRDLLIYPKPVWPTLHQTLVFWLIALTLLATGALVFRQLKPDFADVV